jgi:hypothetical protein
MPKHIYYAEIRNKVATKMLHNPEILEAIENNDAFLCKDECVFILCSEASRIFSTVQDLSDTENISQASLAIHSYADALIEQLLRGEKPLIIDLIVMASQTLQQFC